LKYDKHFHKNHVWWNWCLFSQTLKIKKSCSDCSFDDTRDVEVGDKELKQLVMRFLFIVSKFIFLRQISYEFCQKNCTKIWKALKNSRKKLKIHRKSNIIKKTQKNQCNYSLSKQQLTSICKSLQSVICGRENNNHEWHHMRKNVLSYRTILNHIQNDSVRCISRFVIFHCCCI